jgi:hypothetical protein
MLTGRPDPLPAEWTLGVRPDHLVRVSDGRGLHGRVERLEHVGDAALAWVRPAIGDALLAVRLAPGDDLPAAGDGVCLRAQRGRVHAFDASGRARPITATEGAETQPA